jgi:hypothetical protein
MESGRTADPLHTHHEQDTAGDSDDNYAQGESEGDQMKDDDQMEDDDQIVEKAKPSRKKEPACEVGPGGKTRTDFKFSPTKSPAEVFLYVRELHGGNGKLVINPSAKSLRMIAIKKNNEPAKEAKISEECTLSPRPILMNQAD